MVLILHGVWLRFLQGLNRGSIDLPDADSKLQPA